jgi:two-component system, chemotaxis family, chemotaxis protein CheY
MNVLIAEDDSGCQRLYRDLLADRPEINLIFSANGADAWWHLTDQLERFHRLITDVVMPGVNGIQLVKRLRETPRLQHLPVIICSGVKDRDLIQQAVPLNPAHYMLKPFLPGVMRQKIEALLAHSVRRL